MDSAPKMVCWFWSVLNSGITVCRLAYPQLSSWWTGTVRFNTSRAKDHAAGHLSTECLPAGIEFWPAECVTVSAPQQTSSNCLINVQSKAVNVSIPLQSARSSWCLVCQSVSQSVSVLVAICTPTCVHGLQPAAVRSAFHGRQHKVIRQRPSARAALRLLSCPHSFSVSHCPALTSCQGAKLCQTFICPNKTHSQLNISF